ncbi:MAG TPA: phosphatase PAP2 family protein [Dehalococcoidia bacterium]|nr:phosphatase PAP2 family protein [Dehalococcoidia bacterium]
MSERVFTPTISTFPWGPRPWYRDRRQVLIIAAEALATTVVMVVYFYLRGIRPDAVDESVRRSLHLINFEHQLGLFQEVRWQEAFIDYGPLMSVANAIYAWGHFPVMLGIAIWLVFKDRSRFRFARNVVVVSAIVGLLTYYLLPTAPPRLMAVNGYDFGFVDTVYGATSGASYFQPGPFVNDYAALPSFHFGWIALCSVVIWINTSSRLLRVIAIAMTGVMWWAITVTGNHYFFDMIFGAAVVGLSWVVVVGLAHVPLPDKLAGLVGESG